MGRAPGVGVTKAHGTYCVWRNMYEIQRIWAHTLCFSHAVFSCNKFVSGTMRLLVDLKTLTIIWNGGYNGWYILMCAAQPRRSLQLSRSSQNCIALFIERHPEQNITSLLSVMDILTLLSVPSRNLSLNMDANTWHRVLRTRRWAEMWRPEQ